jgi:putative transcriptional regulator
MLHENLQALRKAKGLSQEELAERLHVVRQTVSKWEKGLSVPDADLLIRLAEVLGTSVSALLGAAVEPEETPEIRQLSQRLADLNQQLAQQKERSRRWRRTLFFIIGVLALGVLFYELVPLHHRSAADGFGQNATAIIGGVDGPTAILISTAVWHGGRIALSVLGLLVAAVGICKTSKR